MVQRQCASLVWGVKKEYWSLSGSCNGIEFRADCRVKKDIRSFVGDVDAAAVACGFGRTFGNKVRNSRSTLS